MASAMRMLRAEHELILRAVKVGEELARRLERARAVSAANLLVLMRFFTFVAHRVHRDKEEDLLFPALGVKGFHEGPGCISALLAQHAEGGEVFQQMTALVEAYEHGNPEAGRQWAAACWRYADNLRQHIRREEEVVFMNAERLLSDDEQQALAAEFERLDTRAHLAGMDEIIAEFESLECQVTNR